MNLRLVGKLLGIVAILIGGTMIFSLPWAHPALGRRARTGVIETGDFETRGFLALSIAILICLVLGISLYLWGRQTEGKLFRKEAMAVVGLSWVLATILGALPFWIRGTYRSPSVRTAGDADTWQVFDFRSRFWRHWLDKPPLHNARYDVVNALIAAEAQGMTFEKLADQTGVADPRSVLMELIGEDADWKEAIILPGEESAPDERSEHARIRWIKMGIADSLFESQSGFSTTGATVISDLEDPVLIPHCLLFWRSSMHFLGGLGIIVLFVVILGQGSAGKALMRAEMPGPSKEGMQARMQHTAWVFACLYCGLNLLLTLILWIQGLTLFDALCHAFGTMATGGFSTYNASLGHFRSATIEYTVLLFMVLAGTNFTLLYLLFLRKPGRMFADVEWRTYIAVLAGVSLLVITFGLAYGDFGGDTVWQRLMHALRCGTFQVVSITTTTGYGTHDFDQWNSFGRGILFMLMFVGGCAGSTGGGLKVIRHILFHKILWLEIEKSYRPSVVRQLRIGGKPVDDPDLRHNILVYFGLILVLFVFSWLFVLTVEPNSTWGSAVSHKLIDSASGVAANLNNIGPGLGTVGASQNYGHFSPITKLLFTWLMMIGRVEIFAIIVLFSPRFWRTN